MSLEERMTNGMDRRLIRSRHELELLIEKLKGLSPLEKLNQGFSFATLESGETLNDVSKVQPGDPVVIYVRNGRIDAAVTGTEKQKERVYGE